MLLNDALSLLGIPAGSDVTAIKRAYAQKIRQYRPDEQPEMFAKIHSAYQQMLRHVRANSLAMQQDEAPPQRLSWLDEQRTTEVALVVNAADPLATSNMAAQPAISQHNADTFQAANAADEAATSDSIAALLLRVERVLGQMPDLAQVHQWQFLAQPLLLDPAAHWQLSREVFLRIVQHHHRPSTFASAAVIRDPRRRPIRMPEPVLQYLDSLLLWRHQREALLSLPVGAEGQQIFNRLDYAPTFDIRRLLRGRALVVRREPEKPAEPLQFEQIVGGLFVGAYLLYTFFRYM